MPCPSNDPGFGDWLSESVMSFGMVIEGMLAAPAARFGFGNHACDHRAGAHRREQERAAGGIDRLLCGFFGWFCGLRRCS